MRQHVCYGLRASTWLLPVMAQSTWCPARPLSSCTTLQELPQLLPQLGLKDKSEVLSDDEDALRPPPPPLAAAALRAAQTRAARSAAPAAATGRGHHESEEEEEEEHHVKAAPAAPKLATQQQQRQPEGAQGAQRQAEKQGDGATAVDEPSAEGARCGGEQAGAWKGDVTVCACMFCVA